MSILFNAKPKSLLGGPIALALAAFTIGTSSPAGATTVTISNSPTNGDFSSLGSTSTQTYGEVFTAPVTGTMSSFTMYLQYPVGALEGGVGTWNGSFSPSELYISNSVPSTAPGITSYTFDPNVAVIANQQYVAFLTVWGVAGANGGAAIMPTGTSGGGIDYFAYTADPGGNAPWPTFLRVNSAEFISAEFAATFNTAPAVAGPTPGTGLASFAFLVLAGAVARARGFSAS